MALHALKSPEPGGSGLNEPLLRVCNLGVSLGDAQIVRGLSYDLKRGETLGVVGESGCGKTISALALLHLTPLHAELSGQAWFAGRDLLQADEPTLQSIRGDQIGVIFQEPMTALNPLMSIGAQIAEMFILHSKMTPRQANAAAADALDRVHIADPNRCHCDYPHQLSGGMRQRVMIAMALACQPQLLIADEPTTALDVTVQAQILDLIMEIQEELGMAVLFISHNLGVISQVADRVMVMYAGRAVEIASTETIMHEPHHPYTQALLATLPRLGARRGRLPVISGSVPSPESRPAGCTYAPRCPLVEPVCRTKEPTLATLDQGSEVACYRAQQLCIAEPVLGTGAPAIPLQHVSVR
ncbi:MAG: ABC transporter ATP-binding protein [Candidatus Competibacteraceae bacterium]|nr:ABC transporter ATP-binding protein [Candidatus Competibacteraceae bacterium]